MSVEPTYAHVTKSTTMPRPTTKRLGEGARCSVLLKLLRPSREVAEAFPDATDQQRLSLFCYFFPMVWFTTILVAKTSAAIQESGGNGSTAPVTFCDMIRFLGIRLLMSTQQGWTVNNNWSYSLESADQGDCPCPFNMQTFMSMRQFCCINRFLTFTDVQAPTFVDRFWEIRQMIKAWNTHMVNVFLAGWVVCLDESMLIWHQHWTSPGWIFCPCKPHPFGN